MRWVGVARSRMRSTAMQQFMEEDVSLFTLPLHDVVFPYIFCHFDILEIWRLRTVCRRFMDITDEYFRVCFSLAIQDTHVADYFGAVHNILSKCEHLVEFRLVGLHYGSVVPASYSGAINKYKTLLTILVTRRVRVGESFGLLKLKRLCLERLELTETHKVIGRLAACCSRLEELVLCSVSPFDDEALEILTSQSDHTKLVKLTVRNVQIQGHSLLTLVAQCPNLKHLCVAYSYRLKLTYLEEVFKNCPNLEWVDVRYVGLVSDRTLLVLREYCCKLKHLFVEGCTKVTENTLTPLRKFGINVDIPFDHPKGESNYILGQI